jgi:hypothetical protein
MPVSSRLIQRLRQEFALDWGAIHGAPHWNRIDGMTCRATENTCATLGSIAQSILGNEWQRVKSGA